MKLLDVVPFGAEELIARLHDVRLKGHDGFPVYRDATISLAPATHTDALAPAQSYVLKSGVARTLALRDALLSHGLDIFALNGGVMVRTEDYPDELIPVIPPVIEESHEPDGRTILLINDGMHRTYTARSVGAPLTVAVVRNVPRAYPYYAFPLPHGWADVREVDAIPSTFERKAYRAPDNHKALFRDFNAVFPGVQVKRGAQA